MTNSKLNGRCLSYTIVMILCYIVSYAENVDAFVVKEHNSKGRLRYASALGLSSITRSPSSQSPGVNDLVSGIQQEFDVQRATFDDDDALQRQRQAMTSIQRRITNIPTIQRLSLMELPKDSSMSLSLQNKENMMSIEMIIGRASIVMALAMILFEITTGDGFLMNVMNNISG